MKKTTAHKHNYDIHPNPKYAAEGLVACTVCGFAVDMDRLRSKVNLEAMTARDNATERLRDLLSR